MTSRVAAKKRVMAVMGGWLSLSLACIATAPRAQAEPGRLPEIKTSAANPVPACVTPDRLMAFLASRNTTLPVKFDTIALAYRDLGTTAHIRWDYAFFQMILETNYLMYRRGDGSSGDVGQVQNNFAGIGATGGGVPGDRYPDVRTGVLAHVQHLLAYSGERVERPVATRTREYQGDIIELSRKLGRPVTFADLSHRWAVDRGYGRNIETIAELYRRTHCVGAPDAGPRATNTQAQLQKIFRAPNQLGAPPAAITPDAKSAASGGEAQNSATTLVRTIWRRGEPVPPAPRQVASSRAEPVEPMPTTPDNANPLDVQPNNQSESGGVGRFAAASLATSTGAPLSTPVLSAPVLSAPVLSAPVLSTPVTCRIFSASYGGTAAVLIRAKIGSETRLTAVTVAHEQRSAMAENYLTNHAPGGEIVANYTDKAAALSAARALCPTLAPKRNPAD